MYSQPKWTPGPWKPLWSESTGEVFIAPIRDDGTIDVTVATLDALGISQDELGANARLISAAPEMYAALKSASGDMSDGYQRAQIFDVIFAAIRKAEGREP
jgi:hypothetical protein